MMLDETRINGKAVVLGAGTMGGAIAAQLANAGWEVSLLDVSLDAAQAGLTRVQSVKPPLLFLSEFAARITPGVVTESADFLREADWIVEAVAERMDVKQPLFEFVEEHAGPETLISSNTSGLSLTEMVAGRSDDFKARFLGTHFLNPPRYLKLLEVIPLAATDHQRVQGFTRFAEQRLGHRVVYAKDTPGFISTRLGIWHLLKTIALAEEHGVSPEDADYLTGPFLGRPRSGTFRMADLVGLDILASIAKNQSEALPDPRDQDGYTLPQTIKDLIARSNLGEKSGAGFYRRDGKDFFVYDAEIGDYRPRRNTMIATVEELRVLPFPERLTALNAHRSEPWGTFVKAVLDTLTDYVDYTAPLIADDPESIDNVMRWGFSWEIGPCATANLRRTRHTTVNFSRASALPSPEYIDLDALKAENKIVIECPEASLIDLGDGIACLEFHTKMNTFDPALCAFLNVVREQIEQEFRGLVVGNQSAHFSAGYNLQRIVNAAERGDTDTLDREMHDVQGAFMGLKYSPFPVVAAPQGFALGAGCECCLHCHTIQAAPETYLGLPEISAGLIPTGGGVTQVLVRAMTGSAPGTDALSAVTCALDLLTSAKRSANAFEARQMGFLRSSDGITPNADRLLYDAKQKALKLAHAGWKNPARIPVPVLGVSGLNSLRAHMHESRPDLASDHDRLIAEKIAFVLCGGDASAPRNVMEEDLLRLERQVFLELAVTLKSLERVRHLLATGKPLRN